MASVDAQPEDGRWSVTSEELERVIFASYIFPTQWARLNGVSFDLTYDRWQASEFYRFFHLKLVDEHAEKGSKRRSFTAGPFKDNVSVVVECATNDGKIVSSRLVLAQDWAAANLMLAIDIAKSFVLSFAPLPDRNIFAEISRALWQLKDAGFVKDLPRVRSDDPASVVSRRFWAGSKVWMCRRILPFCQSRTAGAEVAIRWSWRSACPERCGGFGGVCWHDLSARDPSAVRVSRHLAAEREIGAWRRRGSARRGVSADDDAEGTRRALHHTTRCGPT